MATLDLGSNMLGKEHDQNLNISSSGDKTTVASAAKDSAYKSLGWLDLLLALWILLAIIVGILTGNYVNGAEAALHRGKFVDVSVLIGKQDICNASSLDLTANTISAVGFLVMMYQIVCKVQ
jgi:ACR3 family arsenite transporter